MQGGPGKANYEHNSGHICDKMLKEDYYMIKHRTLAKAQITWNISNHLTRLGNHKYKIEDIILINGMVKHECNHQAHSI